MGLYGWSEWPNFFTVNFCRVPADEMALVLDVDDLCVYSSPVKHFLPNIGLRIELKTEKKLVVYSCDTEPCEEVERLAAGRLDPAVHDKHADDLGHFLLVDQLVENGGRVVLDAVLVDMHAGRLGGKA